MLVAVCLVVGLRLFVFTWFAFDVVCDLGGYCVGLGMI